MNQKKILITTHGFYPEQSPRAFRATELAKEFCRQGHSVAVMAPYRDGMDSLLDEFPITFKSLGKLTWKVPNIQGLGAFSRLFNKVVNRIFPLLFEFPSIELFFKVRKALESEKGQYDVLISIAVPYPIHWGVAGVWKKDNTHNLAPVWIADCGDPYCFQENDTFRPPFYFHWVEKWFMRKADYTSVPTESSYKGYFPEFHPKLVVISQGFRFEDVKKKSTIKDGIIRFGYGGAFIPGRRDPRELLAFLVSLDQTLAFEFHIYTSHGHLVESFAQQDSRIRLHAPVSRLELLRTLSAFDFVVNFANKGTAQTPSKLIDYGMIEKPILHIETGNLDKNLISEFLIGDYSKRFSVPDIDQFRIENVVHKFLALVP